MQLKNAAFTKGQMKALNAIQEKMDRVGIKVENKNITQREFDSMMDAFGNDAKVVEDNGRTVIVKLVGRGYKGQTEAFTITDRAK